MSPLLPAALRAPSKLRKNFTPSTNLLHKRLANPTHNTENPSVPPLLLASFCARPKHKTAYLFYLPSSSAPCRPHPATTETWSMPPLLLAAHRAPTEITKSCLFYLPLSSAPRKGHTANTKSRQCLYILPAALFVPLEIKNHLTSSTFSLQQCFPNLIQHIRKPRHCIHCFLPLVAPQPK